MEQPRGRQRDDAWSVSSLVWAEGEADAPWGDGTGGQGMPRVPSGRCATLVDMSRGTPRSSYSALDEAFRGSRTAGRDAGCPRDRRRHFRTTSRRGGPAVDARRRGPTRRQLEVLCADVAAGSIAAAAYELGIADSTARQHLSGLYRRTGCLNAAQAAYWLGKTELVRPPKGLAARPKGARSSAPSILHPAPKCHWS